MEQGLDFRKDVHRARPRKFSPDFRAKVAGREMMTEPRKQAVYYVVSMVTKYNSLEQVKHEAPEDMAAHIARSKQFHEAGKLIMAGAFLDHPEELVKTMGVLTSREAAEEYAKGDPFVIKGMIREWEIREWANMLR
jgi:uncharacterized protein YciI